MGFCKGGHLPPPPPEGDNQMPAPFRKGGCVTIEKNVIPNACEES